MIKTFEQFVSTVYGSAINEAFQSSKLRELVKKHGKLEKTWQDHLLYDLTDDDIIDVVANSDEFKANRSNGKYDDMSVYYIEFKDGTCVVYNDSKNFYKLAKDRHKGNIKKDWKKNKVDNLIVSYIKRNYKENIEKFINTIYTAETDSKNPLNELIYKTIDEKLNDGEYYSDFSVCLENEDDVKKFIGFSSFSYNNQHCEVYAIEINYSFDFDSGEDHGKYAPATAGYEFDSFTLDTDFGIITNDDLGITPKTYKDLFKYYRIDISDYFSDWEYDYCPPRPH
jgi:hypothetical protein